MKQQSGFGGAHLGMFGRPSILMAPVKKDGGSGGGGGEEEDDEAEEAKFAERFNKLFHSASKERETRFKKDLEKSFGTTLDTKLGELTELIKGGAKPEEQKPGEQKPGEPSKLSPEVQAALNQAAKDAKEAKEAAAKWQKEAQEEKAARAKSDERQQLTTMLQGKVKPSVLEMVVDQLHSKNIVRDEESGKILWKGQDGNTLPLEDGIKGWAKSDVGKEFAPPRNAGGSGSGPSAGGTPMKAGEMTIEGLGDIVARSMGGG